MKLHRHLTTVTPFSKGLAYVLFILLPIVGFLLGVHYAKATFDSTISNFGSTLAPTPVVNDGGRPGS